MRRRAAVRTASYHDCRVSWRRSCVMIASTIRNTRPTAASATGTGASVNGGGQDQAHITALPTRKTSPAVPQRSKNGGHNSTTTRLLQM